MCQGDEIKYLVKSMHVAATSQPLSKVNLWSSIFFNEDMSHWESIPETKLVGYKNIVIREVVIEASTGKALEHFPTKGMTKIGQ